jgi:WhiB family redox-sensing transcriptional regulator
MDIGTPPQGLATGFETIEDAVIAGLELPCFAADAELFFAESPADVEAAKRVCAPCPIRDLCLATALARREPWGVWGGEWFAGGRVMHGRPQRGRPRKTAAFSASTAAA